jgi:cell division cycle 14
MAAYMVIYRGYSPNQAWKKFGRFHNRILPYCHAGKQESSFELEVIDCLRGIEFALQNRWYMPEKFDVNEFFDMGKLESGDMSWILPGKILAMSSPSSSRKGLEPRFFVPFFKENGVKMVIRLNEKMYEHSELEA